MLRQYVLATFAENLKVFFNEKNNSLFVLFCDYK